MIPHPDSIANIDEEYKRCWLIFIDPDEMLKGAGANYDLKTGNIHSTHKPCNTEHKDTTTEKQAHSLIKCYAIKPPIINNYVVDI